MSFNDLIYGKREFTHFEVVDGKIIVSFDVTKVKPEQCTHTQLISSPSCTADQVCMTCGKTIAYITYRSGDTQVNMVLAR